MTRPTHFMPAALASALLMAPMLAHGQAPATPPAGGTGSTLSQGVTPGQPAPPTVGLSPGMTPGGAVGQTPNDMRGTNMGQRGTAGAPTGTMPGMGRMAGAGSEAMFPAGSAVMARPRMSEIIGANVYNQENNSIGSVDDVVLVPPAGGSERGPMAIVQVGGFLGLGGRLVAVPLVDLQWNAENERVVLPGATRESLQQRPEFSYDSVRRSN